MVTEALQEASGIFRLDARSDAEYQHIARIGENVSVFVVLAVQ